MKTNFKIMLLMLLVTMQNLKAQDQESELKTKEKNDIISSIKTHLEESYIDLDLSKKMIIELDKNLKSNKYKKITSPDE